MMKPCKESWINSWIIALFHPPAINPAASGPDHIPSAFIIVIINLRSHQADFLIAFRYSHQFIKEASIDYHVIIHYQDIIGAVILQSILYSNVESLT